MDKAKCAKCEDEFETVASRKMLCEKCDKEMKDEIQVFQIFKWICFACAAAIFSMYIPILAAKENSHGYYSIQGRSRPMMVSEDGMTKWKIAIP
ncbi:MAG TPA: hypothetical protein PKY59_16740, partial [Pyrinomonadaceae bacterium]|nr:hypothetical protein [Pyrinomonadaceae bacterium]